MTDPITAAEVEQAVRAAGRTAWTLRSCSICEAPLRYSFGPEGVFYHGACDCTSSTCASPPQRRSYEDVATAINIQTSPEVRAQMWAELTAFEPKAPVPPKPEEVMEVIAEAMADEVTGIMAPAVKLFMEAAAADMRERAATLADELPAAHAMLYGGRHLPVDIAVAIRELPLPQARDLRARLLEAVKKPAT